MQTIKPLYTAVATATGGRDGRVVSSDGVLDLALAMPRELGGSGKVASNPEQLFAAGYAACFENAVRFIARDQKVALTDSSVKASVGIGPNQEGGFGLSVRLEVSLPSIERETAQALVSAAHEKVCPYSNATRGNIAVDVVLTD